MDDNLKEIQMQKREKGPERDCHRRLLEREVCGRKVSQLFLTFQTKQPFLQKRINVLEFSEYFVSEHCVYEWITQLVATGGLNLPKRSLLFAAGTKKIVPPKPTSSKMCFIENTIHLYQTCTFDEQQKAKRESMWKDFLSFDSN